MAKNKINNSYTVKDCTPFSQDVNDDVLKKLSEYFEKTAEGSNENDDKIVSLQTMLYPYEEGNLRFKPGGGQGGILDWQILQ